jgi:DNA polymerase III alpha subunit
MCALYDELPDVPGETDADDALPPEWSAALVEAGRRRKIPGALRRTLALAARCSYVPPLGGVLFPEVALEEGETAYSRLCALSFEGARTRFRPLRPVVVRRLDYELATIDQLGYAPYFLLVKGIADFARARGIPCVGRGSAADSLVAYCLRLTDADPFRYRLPFERFLNPTRRDRPDIDLDFCWRRRDEVLDHVFELFGLSARR